MATTAIVVPDEVSRIVPAIVKRAQEVKIETADDFEEAAHTLKWIAQQKNKFLDWAEPHKKRLHEAWKLFTTDVNNRVAPVDEARSIIEGKMRVWREATEKLRREQEDALRLQAKKDVEAAAMREAAALEASGDKELADMVIEQAIAAPPPVIVVEDSRPKVEGVTMRKTWKFRIVNADLVPRQYLMVDEKAIGGVVRAMKEKTSIPGVEVYSEENVAVRT